MSRLSATLSLLPLILAPSVAFGLARTLDGEPVYPDTSDAPLRAGAAASELVEVECWEAALYDQDEDGYAEAWVSTDLRETRWVAYEDRLTCDAGWVKLRGDCDDSNPDVHPRRDEVASNGIDDNCDGRVDEPTFRYGIGGWRVTTSGFGLEVQIKDEDVLDVWRNRTSGVAPIRRSLGYRIEYQALSNTGVTLNTGVRTLASISDYGTSGAVSLSLSGLTSNTVYRARVQFYSRVTVGLSTTDTAVGTQSGWFYSVTDHSSARGQARREIVLRGLYESYIDEVLANVGYLGDVYIDGTRYGADQGEAWCSEFYSWVTDRTVSGMGSRASVGSIVEYFDDEHGSYTEISSPSDFTGAAKHGDYLAEDTDLDGEVNHSAMFLAYDTHLGEMWTLDGNSNGGAADGDEAYGNRSGGNEVTVRNRDADVVVGWGSLITGML